MNPESSGDEQNHCCFEWVGSLAFDLFTQKSIISSYLVRFIPFALDCA